MNKKLFENWLSELKRIWEDQTLDKLPDICADKFAWYETPFDKPYITKEELLKDWEAILNQEDISVSYDILSIKEDMCIAHWNATFKRLPSNENVELDGIFMVRLNQEGKCVEFHMWYNTK